MTATTSGVTRSTRKLPVSTHPSRSYYFRSPTSPPRPASPKTARAPRRSAPAGRRTVSYLVLSMTTAALLAISVIMSLTATPATSVANTQSAWSMFTRHIVAMAVGTVALIVAIRVDYHKWRKLAPYAMAAGVAIIAFTAIPGTVGTINGAGRWIRIGPLSVQPSEFVKIALLLWVADMLSRSDRSIDNLRVTLGPIVVMTFTLMSLIMLQPHLGACIVIAAMLLAMLWNAGIRFKPLAALLSIGAFGMLLALLFTWRRERLMAFLTPWDDPLDANYQSLRSLFAIGTGGIDGVGAGMGRLKWGFLPHAMSDFILAVVGEEFGLVGSLLVLTLFISFAIAALYVIYGAPDRFGALLVTGATTWIVCQVILNVAMTTGLMPVVGLTLPLLSYGGSSMIVTMAAIGIVLNVSRQVR